MEDRFDVSGPSIVTMPLDMGREMPHVLRELSRDVDLAKPGALDRCREIAASMCEVMWDKDGIAIAAPQVGYTEKIVVINASPSLSYSPEVLINPRITKHSKATVDDREGCLSLPGYVGLVPRYETVTVEYHNLAGEPCVLNVTGFEARVLQHEIDHLAGTLYIDHVKNPDKNLQLSEPNRRTRARGLIAELAKAERADDTARLGPEHRSDSAASRVSADELNQR